MGCCLACRWLGKVVGMRVFAVDDVLSLPELLFGLGLEDLWRCLRLDWCWLLRACLRLGVCGSDLGGLCV